MAGAIRYIKFSGDYDTFDEWKERKRRQNEKQERLNEVTSRWNTCRIKNTSQDPGMCFNELYNLNSRKNIRNIKMRRRHMYLMSYQKNTNL